MKVPKNFLNRMIMISPEMEKSKKILYFKLKCHEKIKKLCIIKDYLKKWSQLKNKKKIIQTNHFVLKKKLKLIPNVILNQKETKKLFKIWMKQKKQTMFKILNKNQKMLSLIPIVLYRNNRYFFIFMTIKQIRTKLQTHYYKILMGFIINFRTYKGMN